MTALTALTDSTATESVTQTCARHGDQVVVTHAMPEGLPCPVCESIARLAGRLEEIRGDVGRVLTFTASHELARLIGELKRGWM